MVEIKHLCLCLLFSSTHFSIYKDTFAFYKDTKCVQGHAILMPDAALSLRSVTMHLAKFFVASSAFLLRSFSLSSSFIAI